MKLLRLGPTGAELPAAIDESGQYRDLSSLMLDLTPDMMSCEHLAKLQSVDLSSLPVLDPDMRIGCPLTDVPNFFCIGLNYARHADETGMARPSEPIVFSKATSSLHAPNDDIPIPAGSEKTDWEVELGVIIGRETTMISEDDAMSAIAGYCVINDVSERAFQIERGGQWIKGKSAPGFGPIGPWIVTADDVENPQDLGLWLSVNGEMRQHSRTDDMIFSIRQIISHMSQFMTLRVGDIIATGTPEGVGMGAKPQTFLKSGDTVMLGVDGLGQQCQKFI